MKKLFYSIFALVSVVFALTSCEDIPSPYDIPHKGTTDVVAPAGDGTAANPYNVAAIDSILDSGYSTEDDEQNPYYYITGVICSRPSIETSYGNATYYISDDGTSTNQFYIYRSLSFNGAKFTSTDDLQYGDTVVVYTQVYSYSGTYETRSGVCKLISVKRNGQSQGGGGSTTDDGIEITCANAAELALALEDKASSSEIYSVTGYITSVVGSVSQSQQTFWMADTKDGGKVLEAYWANLPTGVTEFTVGSKVKITGYLMRYGTIPEIKNATVTILEEGGGSTPSSGDPKGSGTEADPYNVAGIIAYTSGLTADTNSDKEVYFTGTVNSFKSGEEPGNSYGNATFYITDESTSDKFYCFRVYGPNNEKFTSSDQLKVGDKVLVKATVVNYKGNTPETASGKGYVVKIESSGASGESTGDNTGGSEITGSGTTWTVSSSSVGGVESGTALSTITLTDGTTITFDAGGNTNGPKYYTTGGDNVRVYPKNTITITASKKISGVVINCQNYNGTDCVASQSLGAVPGTASCNGLTYTISGVNSTSTTITNNCTATGTASQLRFTSLTVYYADGSAAKRYARRR